jgi:hypothetical protein
MRAPPPSRFQVQTSTGPAGAEIPRFTIGRNRKQELCSINPRDATLPTIPSFTHSKDLALNSPAHRSLEEITLETEEDHQDWNQRQSRVREQCAPLNGVGPY